MIEQNRISDFIIFPPPSAFILPSPFRAFEKEDHDFKHENLKKLDKSDRSASIVVKKYPNPLKTPVRAKTVYRELNLLRTVRHENIVRLLHSYAAGEGESRTIYLIMTYCGAPLRKTIDEGQYDIEDVKKWTREILLALQYLHAIDIIHGDLNTLNVCVDAENKLTLTDLGIWQPIADKGYTYGDRNARIYQPIEVVVEWAGAYTEKVDIWSMAAMLCEMINGAPLFRGENLLEEQIDCCGPVDSVVLKKIASEQVIASLQAYWESIRATWSSQEQHFISVTKFKERIAEVQKPFTEIEAKLKDVNDFLHRTLKFDADQRMSAATALSHSFLKTVQPWEYELPKDDNEALRLLEQHIRAEIDAAATVHRKRKAKNDNEMHVDTKI